MEVYFKSVFGESTEEVADRQRRGEIKRKSENRTEEEWEQMAKRLKEGSERRATDASVPRQGLDADMTRSGRSWIAAWMRRGLSTRSWEHRSCMRTCS